MSQLIQHTLLLLSISCICSAYKFLVIFQMPSTSHKNLGDGVVRHLLKAGHEVTYLTPYPSNRNVTGLQEIDISFLVNFFGGTKGTMVSLDAILEDKSVTNDLNQLFNLILNINEAIVKDNNVQILLNDTTQSFDAVIAEWIFSEVYTGFASVFNCPMIWFLSHEPHGAIMNIIDEETNPAYIPTCFSNISPPFTFVERIKEFWAHAILSFMINFIVTPLTATAFQNLYGPAIELRGRTVPSYYDVRFNSSLVLGNSYAALGLPIRLPQNYKSISGYHIDTETNPLPKDLQSLLDNAKNGVIYFSMGSILQSQQFPDILKKGLVKMFSELDYDVLWKFEEEFPDIPSNLHILKWAPQQSILAHPNCKLFITHGGLLSTTEAVHHGKQIIGIPVFGDQFHNINIAVSKGFAKRVDLSYEMVPELKNAVEEMMTDQSYREKAKDLSFIYHHRPVHPSKEMVHWIEHVVKTGGALHLRSPALMVPWYQKMYLDFAALVIFIIITLKILFNRFVYSKTNLEKKNK